MKNVCVYKGQPLKIKPVIETLKERGIQYRVKSKFTLRVFHEWGGHRNSRDPLQGGGRKDYIGPVEDVGLFVPESHEQEVRKMLRELLG